MKKIILATLLLTSSFLMGQELDYQSILLDSSLTKNANAIIRDAKVSIYIKAVDEMRVKTRKVITVLNEKGDKFAQTGDVYSNEIRIKDQSAVVYDELGNKIKKYKKKDFEDRSLVGSNDLYNDNRVSFINYIPREYPYTIVYESEVERENTIFVQGWHPVAGYDLSIEKASYELITSADIPFRFKEINTEGLDLEKKVSAIELSFNLKNLPAYSYEPMSPALENFTPHVRVALNRFSLVGRQGAGANWSELGKWEYENLIAGKNELSEATKQKVTELTRGAKNDVEKAQLIYKYVQDNTRYISVQLGIGGWEPMPAQDVAELKYGDCKALTNFTKALLDSQDIPSFYAVVHAGEENKSIDPDFASMEGNHVILNLPQEKEDIWLECTSQTHPFDYLGDFTDNRNVLLLKPQGGEIVKTKVYSAAENLQETSSLITLNESGDFSAEIKKKSSGIPYGDIYGITGIAEKDQLIYYKKNLGHLRNLDIQKIDFQNDRQKKEFSESLVLSGEGLASRAGKSLLVSLNFVPPHVFQLPRGEGRKHPVEVARGKTFEDNFVYILPAGYIPEALPEDVSIENKFGSFQLKIIAKEEEGKRLLEVKRSYTLNEGLWAPESYKDYRDFMNRINTFSNQKAVIAAAK